MAAGPETTGKEPGYEVGYGKPPKRTQFGQPDANASGGGRPEGSVDLMLRVRKQLLKEVKAGRLKADDAATKYIERMVDDGEFRFFSDFIDRDEGKPDSNTNVDIRIVYEAPERIEVPRDVRPSGNGRSRKAQA